MKSRIVILGLAFLLLNSGYSIAEENTQAGSSETTAKEETSDTAKFCLICGPEEKTEALSVSYKYKGKKYSFCSMDCLKAFKKNPEQFIKEEDKNSEEGSWTAPDKSITNKNTLF